MKILTLLMATLLVSHAALADESPFIPWEEFKTLYRDSIEREVRAAPPIKVPLLYTIDDAAYRLSITHDESRGEVTISGKVISGEPEPIPLLGTDAVITELKDVSGGVLLCGKTDSRTAFLPDVGAREFQMTIALLLHARDDSGGQIISFEIPQALKNSLALSLPPEAKLVEHPGILDADGEYRFSPTPTLNVKYIDKQAGEAASIIEIDAVSRISIQKQRIFINSCFLPLRPVTDTLVLTAPQGAQYIYSSLSATSIKALDNGRFELAIPPGDANPFTVEFAMESPREDGAVSVLLPTIESNVGKQGRLVLDEPDEGQATITASGLVTRIPIEKLGDVLSKHAGSERYYMSASADKPVTLSVKWFQPIGAPTIVLDSQYLFTSFEENGNILSVLVMDVPPEFGSRLSLKAVPDSEVWSLRVNNAKKQVLAGEQGIWIVPLDNGTDSHVELAFLKSGAKLALQGKLESVVPETGIPSKNLRVGVALPARVELLFAEGPLSASKGEEWKLPDEFIGKHYFFARSFYKGEGMKLSIAYREPANHASNQKGNTP